MDERSRRAAKAYDANATVGQNRAGVTLGDDGSFDAYVAAPPIDPHRPEELEDEEDPVIRARVHERLDDVTAPPEPEAPRP